MVWNQNWFVSRWWRWVAAWDGDAHLGGVVTAAALTGLLYLLDSVGSVLPIALYPS